MFKNRRWIGLLVLVLIAALALAACGGDDDEPEPTSAPTTAPTVAAEPTEAVVEATEAAPVATEEVAAVATEEAMATEMAAIATETALEPAATEEMMAATEVAMEPAATEAGVEVAMAPTEEMMEPAATEEVAMEPVMTEEAVMATPVATEEMAMEPAATEEAIVAPDLIDCEAVDLSGVKIGLVTDVGQINDKSFNQSSWEGVLAAESCGADVDYIETQDSVDYANNIAEFAENGYNIIVTVGFALGEATQQAAATYPDITFIGVDQFQAEPVDNVVGLVFHEDQSGFLAGILAARLTESGTIAAVLGTDQVPAVVAFNEGYQAGAKYVNPDINIISTYHPGAIDQAFTDPEWGATTSRQALDQGADVVFAAGGKTGNGGLIEVANAVTDGNPPYCIGVDSDQWLTVPEAHPCLVSSAMKLLDKGVADIIVSIVDGSVTPGNFYGASGLAPFHDFEDTVPQDVKDELTEVAASLQDGSISTGYGAAAEEPAATEEAMEPVATEEMMEPVATEEVAMEPAMTEEPVAVAMATEEVAMEPVMTEEAVMATPVATEEMAMEPAATEEAIVAPDLIDCEAVDLSGVKIGLVTDVGQINDKSFNQSSWEGVLAAESCGADVDYIETQDSVDYANNIAEFAENGYNIIVTVGFALGEATQQAAATYPDITFIGVDQFQAEPVDNVVGLVFHEDQSGFLAGILAARLTESGTIAAVLGTDQVPAVVAFNEGYQAGAKYVNPDINIISTYHPGAIDQAFTDPEWGATTSRQALDQGADVVFAAGGKTGNGGLIEVANAVTDGNPPYCIGVDSDQWLTVPEAHPCLVSSAMKLLDKGVADIIVSIVDGSVTPGNFYGASGLAPFHDFEDTVPQDVKDELTEVAASLQDGSISTGYGAAAEEPAATEEAMPMATEEAAAASGSSDLGIVTIGTNAEYPPFEFVDEDNNVTGFDVDLMNAIAADQGFELNWVNTRWDGIFVALQSGEFDAVASAATITDEREEIIDFSNPYFNAGQTIAVKEDNASDISTLEDLAGLRVGVQSGTTGDLAVSEVSGVEVVRYDEITLAFQALDSGNVDAVVNDGPVSAEIISSNPDMGVVIVGDPFTDEFYGIAVNPDKPELLNAVNAGLANIIANGTYEEIYMNWFGVEPPSQFMPAE